MAETFQLVIEIDGRKVPAQATRVRKGMNSVENAASRTSRTMSLLNRGLLAFGVGFSAAAVVRGLRSVVGTAAGFEQLRASLHTVLGSARAATTAFKELAEFSARTPFQLEELTRGYTQLVARGFNPTAEAMTAVGNLASGMGKTFEQALNAITQAAFGETESIKSFGVLMKQETDLVKVRFRGMEKSIKRDTGAIFNHLIGIAKANFAGGMKRQANTFTGSLSTLKDNTLLFAAAIGDELLPMLTELNKELTEVMPKLQKFASFIGGNLRSMLQTLRIILSPQGIAAGIQAGRDAWDSYANSALHGQRVTEDGAESFGVVGDSADDAADKIDKAREALEKFVDEATRHIPNPFDFEPTDLEKMVETAENRVGDFFEQNSAAFQNLTDSLEEAYIEAWDRFKESLTGERGRVQIEIEQDDPTKLQKFGSSFSSTFAQGMQGVGQRMGDAAIQAILSGEGSLKDMFNRLGASLVAQLAGVGFDSLTAGIGNAFAIGSGAAAGVAAFGVVFAAAAVSAISASWRKGPVLPGLEATVDAFSGATDIFRNSIFEFADAARLLADVARSIRGQLSGLFGPIGGFSFDARAPFAGGPFEDSPLSGGESGGMSGATQDPSAKRAKDMLSGILGGIVSSFDIFVQELNGQWTVAIEGIATGFGDSLESAMEQMMDVFVQRIPAMIEDGRLALEHVPDALVEVLKNSGAQSFDELKEIMENATRVFLQSLGPIQADMFTFFNTLATSIEEAIRTGLQLDVAAQAFNNELDKFISGVAGVDLFPKFADGKAIMEEFAAQLERFGIEGEEAAERMEQMGLAVDLFNRQARVSVLGQLADMAREFGIRAEFVKKIERARVRIQFAIIRAQLESLGIFEQFRHIWRQIRQEALAAARDLGGAAKAAGDIGDAFSGAGSGGGGGGIVPVEIVADSSGNEDRLDTFRAGLADFIAGFSTEALNPVEALVNQFQSVVDLVERIKQDSRQAIALAEAQAAFAELLAQILEALRADLQSFRDSLDNSPQFNVGTRGERAENAVEDFQALLASALGGDLDSFLQLEDAAALALELAQAAFGSSSGEFQDIFDLITGGLDSILGLDFSDLFGDVDPFADPLGGLPEGLAGIQDEVSLQTQALVAEMENADANNEKLLNKVDTTLKRIEVQLAVGVKALPV